MFFIDMTCSQSIYYIVGQFVTHRQLFYMQHNINSIYQLDRDTLENAWLLSLELLAIADIPRDCHQDYMDSGDSSQFAQKKNNNSLRKNTLPRSSKHE